ncbi:tumor necrosis factor receptor superfamily member 14-like [Cyprinodon tularosa]|uniref:tumor necrosis factor receptor superfamily member 14-like n=1 Tax=Cyprinodon tularosa TaxID=77115 RepID=UPI0018E21215|nr:tumor necrosis factor receptor superfamily member 14-like [Cyprinodon tularosa]
MLAGSGLRLKIKCSRSSDTVCEALEGYFCIDDIEGSCDAAEKHSSCKPGQYISKKGTSLSDTECSECSRGTFSNGSLTLCQPHTQCSESQTKVQEGSSTSDVVCSNGSIRHRYTLAAPFLGLGVIIGLLLIRGYKIHRRFSIRKDESYELQESLLRTELN